jgi:hypothetical protein
MNDNSKQSKNKNAMVMGKTGNGLIMICVFIGI